MNNKHLAEVHTLLAEHHLGSAKLHKACSNCNDADRADFHKAMAAHHTEFAVSHLACAKALQSEVDRGGAGDLPTGSLDGPSKTLTFRAGFAEGSLMHKAQAFDQLLGDETSRVHGTLIPRAGGPAPRANEDPTATVDRFARR